MAAIKILLVKLSVAAAPPLVSFITRHCTASLAEGAARTRWREKTIRLLFSSWNFRRRPSRLDDRPPCTTAHPDLERISTYVVWGRVPGAGLCHDTFRTQRFPEPGSWNSGELLPLLTRPLHEMVNRDRAVGKNYFSSQKIFIFYFLLKIFVYALFV